MIQNQAKVKAISPMSATLVVQDSMPKVARSSSRSPSVASQTVPIEARSARPKRRPRAERPGRSRGVQQAELAGGQLGPAGAEAVAARAVTRDVGLGGAERRAEDQRPVVLAEGIRDALGDEQVVHSGVLSPPAEQSPARPRARRLLARCTLVPRDRRHRSGPAQPAAEITVRASGASWPSTFGPCTVARYLLPTQPWRR